MDRAANWKFSVKSVYNLARSGEKKDRGELKFFNHETFLAEIMKSKGPK